MKYLFILAVLSIITAKSFGQNVNLDDKWNKMMGKANTYQEYKVIKISELGSIWKSVQEHVRMQDSKLTLEKNLITQQQGRIVELERQTLLLNQKLEAIRNEKDNMSFLKLQVNKYTYAMVLWVFIAITLVGSAILFFLFKSSNKVTVQKIKDFTDLSKAFEEYKQCKIEVEKKLKRELQTYLNKSEEMKKEKAGFGRGY